MRSEPTACVSTVRIQTLANPTALLAEAISEHENLNPIRSAIRRNACPVPFADIYQGIQADFSAETLLSGISPKRFDTRRSSNY
jgi:hypothetical protein